ncbi:hypothetical protein RI129_010765 [Pyrocoelia pectoralis]|uniref:Uncharacterized protein n=1 Tax=Pyrocoelia pectoralis TaxID=417401 RepID=A0AAN7V4V6_9COLE
MNVTLFLLLATLSELCQGARILGVIPTPSYSHQVVFQPLWKELSLRGHQVTVLTTNPIKDSSLTNLTEIDLSFSYKFLEDNLAEIINSSQNVLKWKTLTMLSLNNVVDAQLQHPEVHKLIRDPNEHFDLLIVEYIMVPPIYFSKRFNCPYIGVLSMAGYSTAHTLLGNFDHPIVYPRHILQVHGKPNLIQRIYLAAMEFILDYVMDINEIPQQIVKKRFDDETPMKEVLQNASLLFVNSDPIFHHQRPLLPSIIPIGGNTVRVQAEPLENVS